MPSCFSERPTIEGLNDTGVNRSRWKNNSCDGNLEFYRHTLYGLSGLSIFGVPANLLVIILVFRARKKKFHSMTFLLLNLAVADLINILLVDTAAILVLVVDDHRKQKMKQVMPVLLLTLIPVIVTNFTLAMIAFERYNALVKTMKSLVTITKKKVYVAISISWLIASSLVIPIVIHKFPKNFTGRAPEQRCQHARGNGRYIFWSFFVFFGYLIPLVVLIFCYARILKGVYIDGTILGKTTNKASLNEKKSLVRTLLVVTLLFFVCNVPAVIIRLYMFDLESTESCIKRRLYLATVFLGCMSSCLNPIVYALKSENYRSQVKTLFGCNHGKENGSVPPTCV